MIKTSSLTVYQLLESDLDFAGQGFEVLLTRVPFDPGRGKMSRLAFVDPDFDPLSSMSSASLITRVDGDPDSNLSTSVSLDGSGTVRRIKIYVNRIGRYFGINWQFSSGEGTLSNLVDESGNQVVDDSGNDVIGTGAVERFRLLGQTFGFQRMGSFRK